MMTIFFNSTVQKQMNLIKPGLMNMFNRFYFFSVRVTALSCSTLMLSPGGKNLDFPIDQLDQHLFFAGSTAQHL